MGFRVMMWLRLHLTPSGVVDRVIGIRKIFHEKIFSVGKHLSTHGGRFGRAMIKYPLYKKNNSRNFTLVYPGLTTVSFDRIINL